jgi:hypothetical protein
VTRFIFAFMVAMALAGCASRTSYLVDESSSPAVEQAYAALDTNKPVYGARSIGLSNGGPVGGPRAYNSDNRPTSVRTGIGSDPDNPNGAPQ